MKNKVFVPFIVYIYLESEKQEISFYSFPETCLELKFLFIFYFEVLGRGFLTACSLIQSSPAQQRACGSNHFISHLPFPAHSVFLSNHVFLLKK